MLLNLCFEKGTAAIATLRACLFPTIWHWETSTASSPEHSPHSQASSRRVNVSVLCAKVPSRGIFAPSLTLVQPCWDNLPLKPIACMAMCRAFVMMDSLWRLKTVYGYNLLAVKEFFKMRARIIIVYQGLTLCTKAEETEGKETEEGACQSLSHSKRRWVGSVNISCMLRCLALIHLQ